GRRVGILLLHGLLHAISGVGAARRAGDGRERLALAATELIGDRRTDDATDDRARDAVLVLRLGRVRDFFIPAALRRCLRGGGSCGDLSRRLRSLLRRWLLDRTRDGRMRRGRGR